MNPNAKPAHQSPHASRGRAADRMAAVAMATVEVVFGIPGGTIAAIDDALIDYPNMRRITTRHESNAIFAACGYAWFRGRPGIVAVTSGPGILNCMNGLASAHREGIPLVVLAGEVPRPWHGKGALQDGHELDIRGMLRPITRWVAEVPAGSAAAPMLHQALRIASGEDGGLPGPVVLLLPLDVTTAPAPKSRIDGSRRPRTRIPRSLMIAVRKAVRATGRGAILAGAGVRSGGGPAALLRVAERLQWPVITTPRGKGTLSEAHPLSLGVFAMGGHQSARAYLQGGIDTLLAVGTGLGELATDGWSPLLQPKQTLIHVDIDTARIGRHYPADIVVRAPAEDFLTALHRTLRRHSKPRLHLPGVIRDTAPARLDNGPKGKIEPARALHEIQTRMPDDTILVVDSGSHTFFANHYLRITRPDAYLTMLGLGSMGASISAMGIALAAPKRPVAVICGDGGFAMMAPEIATCAQHGLEVVFYVFNNQSLSMVEDGNRRIYGRTPRYDTGPIDIPGLARSMGARSVAVTRADEILALDLPGLLDGGPLVVDVHIDRQVKPPAHGRFEALTST